MRRPSCASVNQAYRQITLLYYYHYYYYHYYYYHYCFYYCCCCFFLYKVYCNTTADYYCFFLRIQVYYWKKLQVVSLLRGYIAIRT